MALHKVVKDGKTVWKEEFDEGRLKNFPEEYRGRPDKGVVVLLIDDVEIGVQVPLDEKAEADAAAAQAAAREEG